MNDCCAHERQDGRRPPGARGWVRVAAVMVLLAMSSLACAWESRTIATHPTWVYQPAGTLPGSDQRGLMVLLHGCLQTADQVKGGLHLEPIADRFGLVIAVPYVTKSDGYIADCWDYDGGTSDNHGHLDEIIKLTKELSNDPGIDPRHVYVAGLSSGGALALKLGCKTPERFAGIAAIAGPSVGSSQYSATADQQGPSPSIIKTAIDTCKALAGDRSNSFNTQIANIAYGDMDRNGPKVIDPSCPQTKAGQNCVASIWWNENTIEALRALYGAGKLGPAAVVSGGQASERAARVGDQTVLALLVMNDVGHAFAAGSGQPNTDTYGQYIAQQGVNHLQYAADWLIKNNRRVVGCKEPRVSGNAVTLECRAGGPRRIADIHVIIQGPGSRDDRVAGDTLNRQYDGLAPGKYRAEVTATDDQGAVSPAVAMEFRIGGGNGQCISAQNQEHLAAGRAEPCWWWYCAKGSGHFLGYFASTLRSLAANPDQPDYWRLVDQCPQ